MNRDFERGGRTIWIVGDARLDNTAELIRRWGLTAGSDDAEILLHAYLNRLADFPAALLGDFSFALFDAGERQLWLVRDHCGIRPLYYRQNRGSWYASDALAPLLARPEVMPDLDEETLASWCEHGRVHHTSATFFSGLHKVQAANVLQIDAQGRTDARVYWQPEANPPLMLPHEDDYRDQLGALLQDAVRLRMPTDGHAAAHSSGGLDSTPIAVWAARRAKSAGQGFHSYNWTLGDSDASSEAAHEWADARRLAQEEGMHHLEIGSRASTLKRDLLTHDPARDGTAMLHYERQILNHASQAGITRIFSGFGGDEFLTQHGPEWHLPALRAGRWAHVLSCLVQERNPASSLNALRVPVRFGRLAWQAVRATPDWQPADEKRQQIRRALYQELAPALATRYQSDAASRSARRTIRQDQQFLRVSGYHQERIESWALMAAPYGVRHVYPYLDRRVVDFAFALPETWFFRAGQTRYLYRRAVGDALPTWLADKQKPREYHRVRQLVNAWLQALGDPELMERVAASDSPYIDTTALLARCRAATSLADRPMEEIIPVVKAMTSAVLALNLHRPPRSPGG